MSRREHVLVVVTVLLVIAAVGLTCAAVIAIGNMAQ